MSEIIPAILTSDLNTFKHQINKCVDFGAQTVQIDFTDGKYVNSKTLLPDDLDAFILSNSGLILEAHLMVEQPEQYFGTLYALGFNRVAVHYSSIDNPDHPLAKGEKTNSTHLGVSGVGGLLDILNQVHELGMEIGIAINPHIDLEKVEPYIPPLTKVGKVGVDFILFLTVFPGAQGKAFQENMLKKINAERLHRLKKKHKKIPIEVDGGVKLDNIKKVVSAGADRIVVGSGIWKSDDPKKAFEELKILANSKD